MTIQIHKPDPPCTRPQGPSKRDRDREKLTVLLRDLRVFVCEWMRDNGASQLDPHNASRDELTGEFGPELDLLLRIDEAVKGMDGK